MSSWYKITPKVRGVRARFKFARKREDGKVLLISASLMDWDQMTPERARESYIVDHKLSDQESRSIEDRYQFELHR